MLIESHVNKIFQSISYRIGKTIIDPGDFWEGFEFVDNVLLTHAHFDHIYGLNRLLELNPDAMVYTNAEGKDMLFNAKKNMSRYNETPFVFEYPDSVVVVTDGFEVLQEDGVIAKAFFTPGHNPSCITWMVNDWLFTGDSYIPGIKTVTNLPGGNKFKAEESIVKIQKLAESRIIYSGHCLR